MSHDRSDYRQKQVDLNIRQKKKSPQIGFGYCEPQKTYGAVPSQLQRDKLKRAPFSSRSMQRAIRHART